MTGFPRKFVEIVVCQKTLEPLSVDEVRMGDTDHILQGTLVTSSGKKYEIKDGILNLLDEKTLYEEAKKEIPSRRQEASTYDKRLSSRYYKEVPSTMDPLKLQSGFNVIDYGCGTGRISSELHDTDVLGIDISLESLKVFNNKETKLKSLGLVCADATNFYVKDNSFDRALSSQVYEHIPTEKRRIKFLENVNKALKPGGIFVATMYHYNIRRRIYGESKENYHPSGILYHYFGIKELSIEFEKVFEVISINPIDITLPLEARLKLSPKFGGIISRISERLPVLNRFGHLLRVSCKVHKDTKL